MEKSYEVHVLIRVGTREEWRGVGPTGSEPYRFVSKEAADWHLVRSYPVVDSQGRTIRKVVEVDKPQNISLT